MGRREVRRGGGGERMPYIDFEELLRGIDPGSVFWKRNSDGTRALAELVWKLRNKLFEYDTLLSDDASGRIPTLFLREMAVQMRKNSKDTKREAPNTYFVSGGRHGMQHVFNSVANFIKSKPHIGKTLLVTEFISSGRSILELIKILEQEGINFDVAAPSVEERPEYYSPALTKRMIYGAIGSQGLAFYDQAHYGGTTKSMNRTSAHPTPIKDRYDAESQKEEIQLHVNTTRKEISVIADRLCQMLFEAKK